jgi:predicted dehydrogenase
MKALVVGLGRMGRFHRKVLMDLGYDVVTVDPDPATGADYLSVPAGRRPEVVCVAVPIAQLAEVAAEFTAARHLLIEKPMAPSLGEAIELADRLAGQHVAVGYVERFNPTVRALQRALADAPPPIVARFRRWSDRPSPDRALDLMSHDVDLAAFLRLRCPTEFDAADDRPVRVRDIMVRTSGRTVRADLTAHDTSPLHAQWHAFLSGRPGYATPADATAVLAALAPRALGVAA